LLACAEMKGEGMRFLSTAAALVLSSLALAAVERSGGMVTDASMVELEGVSGSIVVEPGDAAEVEVDWTVTAETAEQLETVTVESREEDGILSVWVDFSEDDVSLDGHAVDFRLRVPADWEGQLDLQQVSGDITCADGGPYDLTAQCVSGDLEVFGVTGDVRLRTVSGGLSFADLPGLREAQVVSGTMQGSVQRLEGHVEVDCVSGTIDLAIPDDLPGRVDVSTMSGGIEIDDGLSGFALEEGVAGFSAGRGTGEPVLSISSLSGEVALRSL